jgi:hypothetical protein
MGSGSCQSFGHIDRLDRLVIGSPALERRWKETWATLRKLGLIRTTEAETHCERDGWRGDATFVLTAWGRTVLDDYFAWECELDAAIATDDGRVGERQEIAVSG